MELISAAGQEVLRREVEMLIHDERPKVVSQVSAAAAEGDRSENAEYIYGKKRLREIDRRMNFLTKRLEKLTVREAPVDNQKVQFLSWVLLEDEDERQVSYLIVGSDEAAPEQGMLSYHSPIGRALLGRRVDEEVTISIPKGEVSYLILDIQNHPPKS